MSMSATRKRKLLKSNLSISVIMLYCSVTQLEIQASLKSIDSIEYLIPFPCLCTVQNERYYLHKKTIKSTLITYLVFIYKTYSRTYWMFAIFQNVCILRGSNSLLELGLENSLFRFQFMSWDKPIEYSYYDSGWGKKKKSSATYELFCEKFTRDVLLLLLPFTAIWLTLGF